MLTCTNRMSTDLFQHSYPLQQLRPIGSMAFLDLFDPQLCSLRLVFVDVLLEGSPTLATSSTLLSAPLALSLAPDELHDPPEAS
jgi:hypothetical protein